MHARSRSIVILALLVMTAGCVAAPGAGDASGSALDDSTPDGASVAATHERALDAAGSYTYEAEASATIDGENAGSSSLSAAVDRPADRTLVETGSVLGPVVTYVENGTAYQRIGAEEPQYRTLEIDAPVGDLVSTDVAPVVRNNSFEANGSTTVAGEQVRLYEAHATGSNATLQTDLGEGVTVDSVDVTLAVRDDGLIVRQHTTAAISLDGDGRDGTFTRTVTYSDIGTTEVTAPDWIEDARDAGSADA